MSADFWAGYVSGAIGILVGNPLDLLKTRIQSGGVRSSAVQEASTGAQAKSTRQWTSLVRGAAAPILGYGALNALLFVTYNRSLAILNTGNVDSEQPSAWSIWAAGALGGLATFFVSAPTELVKCRAQVISPPKSSLNIAKDLWKSGRVRGMYLGGGITSMRDAVGYGFYFWSYELSKRAITSEDDSENKQAVKVMLCGGLAGVVTWASIFPLDVIKTRVQTWDVVARSETSVVSSATQPLLRTEQAPLSGAQYSNVSPSAFHLAREAYTAEGISVFFRGLGVCSARAFLVNAVQWAIYEWMMKQLAH